jgi:hypothetical protein
MANSSQGQNFRRLVVHKMSHDAIPSGGGLDDGLRFLSNKESIVAGVKAAQDWVALAIRAVREAAEPNPWKDADDEAIAGEILRQIREKNR